MKKLVSILLILAVTLLIAACGNKAEEAASNTADKPTVVLKVEEYINSIGEVDLDDEELLKQIEKAFELLDDDQKAMVSNADVYEDAKEAIEFLKALSETEPDLTKSDEVLEVEEMIASISTVSLSNEEKLNEIEKLYNALSKEDKKKVSNYSKYEQAVADTEDLKNRLEFADGGYSIEIIFDGHKNEIFTGTGIFGIPRSSKFYLNFYGENGELLNPTDVVLLDPSAGKIMVRDGKTILYTSDEPGKASKIVVIADGLVYDGAVFEIVE